MLTDHMPSVVEQTAQVLCDEGIPRSKKRRAELKLGLAVVDVPHPVGHVGDLSPGGR